MLFVYRCKEKPISFLVKTHKNVTIFYPIIMGFDIMAYFYVNQTYIDNFIQENNIDRKDRKQHDRIVEFYKTKYPEVKDVDIIYSWNRADEIHDFWAYCGTNFIRDDKRFTDERYHRTLIEKHNRLFPDCLTNINLYLRTAKDAIEIADELTIFFGDDDDLMDFADWLRRTSKNCAYYELSS